MGSSNSRIKVSLFAILLCAPISAQGTNRVSVATGGAQGNGGSFAEAASISADGRHVAFFSQATNFVAGDTNGFHDIFVRDRLAGTTELVSVDSGGVQGNGLSNGCSISADGRYVAFRSDSSNLVLGDTNGVSDCFVHDRQGGTTEQVSVATGGVHGNDISSSPQISADGRYVAFHSFASNLVSGDTNAFSDIFVRDLQANTTERVNLAPGGVQANTVSYYPSISADGRFVAFKSYASNLVPGDTNGFADVFVRDRQLGTTERVSIATGGAQGNGISEDSSISADGRYVAFRSVASNLVSGDTNGFADIFVRDRQSTTTERMNVASGGAQANDISDAPSISADGRCVAFYSAATNLVPGDTNGFTDCFLRVRLVGATERVDVDSSGAQGNDVGGTGSPSISADGRYVAFHSLASNLVVGDTNGTRDVFLRDRGATNFTSMCDPGVGGVIPCPCSNPPAGSGRGCNNFGAGPVDSGTLTATGVASLASDSVVLTATGENNTSLTVFWTGKDPLNPTGVAHGAGVRCVTQALKRMYTHSASGGTVSAPVGADLSVSARTAQVYGTAILAGETRHYFAIYRDPQAATPCGNTSSTINLTNAGSITWNP